VGNFARGNNKLRIEEFCYWGAIRRPPETQTHVCTD
jgi:hypothetical protein